VRTIGRLRVPLRPPPAGALLLPTMLAAGLLLAVKLGDLHRGAADSFAAVTPASAQEPATAIPGPVPDASAAAAPADALGLSPGEVEILQRLGARRAALDERERRLELRAAALEAAEAKLRAQIARLEALRAELEADIERRSAEEEARLQSLIKIYETMRPKDAAAIFNRLEMPVLLAVVEGMREAKSAPVIAAMNPATAERLTRELAQRRRLPTLGD
jgi:flagellar motility protein MotE (MotC chaperone)